MLIFTEPNLIDSVIRFNTWTFNLTSMYEWCHQLTDLNPYHNNKYSGYTDTYDFDIWYRNHILNSPSSYKEFMQIMRILYNGDNVIILADLHNTFSMNVVESLQKLILERYGYVSNIAKEVEDTSNLVDGELTQEGIRLLDMEFDNMYVYYQDSWYKYNTQQPNN